MNKEKLLLIPVIGSAAALLVGVAFGLFFIFFQPKQSIEQEQEDRGSTREEILRSLSIPSGNASTTKEERREIMEVLSKPSTQEPSSQEEREAILEALRKPAQ